MQLFRGGYLLIAVAFCVSACGTQQYYAERNICQAQADRAIPPQYQQVTVRKTRTIEVPTGDISCVTSGSTTNCTQKKRTETIPYTDVETVDVNKDRRQQQVDVCTANACLRKYGNTDCEVK